ALPILFDGSFLNRGVYIMKNFSGTIEVHFTGTDSFDVNATSLKGSVINQASFKPDTHGNHHPASKYGQSLFGTMNDGHAKVELSSFSGTIKILKRDYRNRIRLQDYSQPKKSVTGPDPECRIVCLTGFMGSGKSTVGRLLAAQL